MRTLVLFIGLVGLPLSLKADEAKTPPEGWKEYSPRTKTFSVWLPEMGGRRSERERTFILRTTRVRVSLVQLEMNDGMTLSAGTTSLPISLSRKIPKQERIELFRDAYVKHYTGKIEGEKEVKSGPFTGKEYTITTGRGLVRLRLFAGLIDVYEASVSGTKEQVESKLASTFLESYKLPTFKATDGTNPPEDKLADRAAKILPGDLFAFLQDNVKEKRVVEADLKGFTLAKTLYREVPEKGGVLIGFNVGFKKFLNKDVINALQPIYLTKDGEIRGEWHGPKPASATTVKAKPGYVVGGIKIRTGLGIDGFSLNCMKLEKDRLQVKETHKSDWVGTDGGSPSEMGGHGYFFVGIHGHLNDQGEVCSLGLITVLKPKE